MASKACFGRGEYHRIIMDDDAADDASVELIDQVADDASVRSGDVDREGPLEDDNVPFALTPAIAIQGIINYQRTSGRKMYMGAIAKSDKEL
jgi:hypothetical protein